MTEHKWGGKRVGAGRPKQEKVKKQYTFRLSDKELQAVRELLNKIRGKLVILFLIFCCLCTPVFAQTIKGGVTYTEQNVKQEAFKDVLKYNKMYLGTPKAHYNGINNNVIEVQEFRTKLLKIIPFNCLAVTYKDEPNKAFYYEKKNNSSKLLGYDIIVNRNSYPKKIIKYNATGNLLSISLEVAENDSYVYDKDGNLIARWVNNQGRDYTTKTKMKREIMYFAP